MSRLYHEISDHNTAEQRKNNWNALSLGSAIDITLFMFHRTDDNRVLLSLFCTQTNRQSYLGLNLSKQIGLLHETQYHSQLS